MKNNQNLNNNTSGAGGGKGSNYPPQAKTSKNANRRTQMLSQGGGPLPGNASLQINTKMSGYGIQGQIKGDELDQSMFAKQNQQMQAPPQKNHQRTATMAQPVSGGANLIPSGNQQYAQRNMVTTSHGSQAIQNHQKNLTMNLGSNQQMMGMMNSPQNANVSSQTKNLTMNNAKQQTRNGVPAAKQSQRRAGPGPNQSTIQPNSSHHQRGRSSGVVMLGTDQVQFEQMVAQQQQQQMSMTMSNTGNQGPAAAANYAANSGNPFRRQKQQAKHQQKYQQQLQMYSSSNRILNQGQQTKHNKNNSTINYNSRQQQQLLQEQQIQQVQQQLYNYNNHVRSLSNSNCSGGPVGQNYNQNLLMHAQMAQAQARGGPQGDHRKAPSSISLLNQTSISNNLNTSNLLIPNIGAHQAGQGRPNFANINNMGNIAMTHQNLLIQPQISQKLTTQQINENKVTEQQILESEEYFESGKLFLAEKKYKDATKMFTKSLVSNQTNYDALFYRAVTNLDQELPEKAIADLEELMKICSDYRKTMFIVLSIAYRRVNDYLSAIRALSKAIQKYPSYLEAYIARGQIYIFQKKWDKALSDFKTVLRYSPLNGMGYLGQGDSHKGLNQIEEAVKSYSRVIEVDPQTMSQGLMKRGLLYLQLKKNEEALKDFNQLTEMAEEQNQDFQSTSLSKAYFYKAKALKKMNNMNDSVLYFEQVLRLSEDNFLSGSSLYEIAKIKIQQKDFYEAHYNLQRSNHLNLKQKKLQNYKLFAEGVIFLMKRKTKTGVKLLTQVIDRMKQKSQQTNKSAVKKEGEENKNATNNNSDSQNSLSNNSKTALNQESAEKNKVIAMMSDEKDYIFPLLFIYRAYGYIVLEEYDKGLKDFIKSSQIKKLNASQNYNMILCQGLKNFELKEFENAISFFGKAAQKQSKKRDPYLLRAMAIVQYTVNKPIKPKTKIQMLKDAKKDLHRALEQSPKDESVLFLRGILNFALHRFYDAISDFERVIEKAEETNAIHYLARGRCYACLSMFKEAITDLSIAINLNKDLLDAYLNRGKCAYLIGDTGLAFMDFQKLIVLEPKNPSVHIYAGNLLMTTGSYEDATKAFTNADNIQKSPLALYQRSRCHVALNNMSEALDDLNKVIEISMTDKVAIQDRECLNALKSCSVLCLGNEKPIEKVVFQKAAQAITKLISYEKNEHLAKLAHESSIQHQHSQIIPSAHRTKMDKIRAIKRRKEQDKLHKEGNRRNDLRFRVQQQNEGEGEEEGDEYEDISELDDAEIEKLNRKLERNESDELDQQASSDDETEEASEDANYYKENIFNKEDFYLYRGILYIYGEHYEKAIQDLEQCSNIMHQNKVLYPKNQFSDKDLEDGYESPTGQGNVNGQNDDNVSNDSSQTDLSDVGLCSLNIHEFSVNTVLCMILAGDYKKALSKLDYIIDTIAKKYAHQLWIIRGVINEILGYSQQSKKDFKRAYKYDRENATKLLEKQEDIYLNVFPQQQRLCNFFQFIKVDFKGYKGAGNASIYLKPSFSFPFIKPPNMIPCVDQNVVLEQFQLKKSNVQLKPEAPWIKKCQFGIKFTEEIYYTDDDREPTPDEEKEYKKRKQRQQERAMEGAGFIRAHSEKVELKNNIFAEDNAEDGQEQELLDGEIQDEEAPPKGRKGAADKDEELYIYQDENGNPVNLADLQEFEGELGDLGNLEGVEDALAEQMKILREMQMQQAHLKKQEGATHKRNKTQQPSGAGKAELDIQELDYDENDEAEEVVATDQLALDGSPLNDFNKLQNISNLKDIAKEVAGDLADDVAAGAYLEDDDYLDDDYNDDD